MIGLHPPGSDWVSDEVRRTGQPFEAVVLDELVRRVRRAGTIVDVGAHIGNHAAWFATHLPHRTVHAFEPWPANLDLLRANVADLDVEVHPVALSDRHGHLRLRADPGNAGHVYVDPDGPLVADAVPLDSFGFADVTLLKVDVEGHEPQVLAGAQATIDRWQPLIVVEDWRGIPALPGYRLLSDWGTAHQTYLLGPVV